MAEFNHPQLQNLSPDARLRVESALKQTLETELTKISSTSPIDSTAMTHSRSRGAIFSRSRTSDSLRDKVDVDQVLVQNAQIMDDTAFAKFAERLTQIKGLGQKQ